MNANLQPASPSASFIATTDNEGGAIGSAPDISETVLMMAGTYCVRVRPLNTVSLFGAICPYAVDVRWLRGRRYRRGNRQMQM